MKIKDYFNSLASEWDNIVYHDRGKISKIAELLDIKEDFRVLDVGTGTGVMIPVIRSYLGSSGEIVAIDIAEKMIEIAVKKFPFENVKFVTGDVLKGNLPANYFDVVLCYSVFPHFNDQKSAVDILSRCLKIGGKLAICHSQSRKEINALHKKSSEQVKNASLPEVSVIDEYFEGANLKTCLVVDNDDMFVVIGQK